MRRKQAKESGARSEIQGYIWWSTRKKKESLHGYSHAETCNDVVTGKTGISSLVHLPFIPAYCCVDSCVTRQMRNANQKHGSTVDLR